MDDVTANLKTAYFKEAESKSATPSTPTRPTSKMRRTIWTRVHEAVKAIALCHNVTPVYEEGEGEEECEETEADQQNQQSVSYQASSPDEVRGVRT